MTEELILAIFPTRTHLGQKLASEVKGFAEAKYGFRAFIIEYNSLHSSNYSWEFIRACADADAIVLDMTLEETSKDNNYRIIPPFYSHERVLIVSRSYVPINLKGCLEGGTAKYSDSYTPLGQKTNQSILDWLDGELEKISKNPRKFNFFQKILPWYFRFGTENWGKLKQKESLYRKKNQIFVSYRSRHHSQVIELVRHLKNEDKYRDTFIFYFDPGELVYEDELLSPLRRWQLLSMIQDQIIASREVWLYLTEDYLDSWWTKGEVLSTLRFTSQNDLSDKLKIYDPQTDVVHPIDTKNLPQLSETHVKRMNRYQTNSHPGMMAPEVLDRNQLVEEGVLSGIPAIRKLFMLDEPAFSSEFWDYYIIPCGFQKRKLQTKHGTVSAIDQFYEELKDIDIDDFLKLFREGELIVSLEQLKKAAEGIETLKCPDDLKPLAILEQRPRYLWVMQLFSNQQDGSLGRLRAFPVFRLIHS